MSSNPGYFPIQCDRCGRELINMGCNICSLPERFTPPPLMRPTTGSPKKLSQLEAHLALIAQKNSGGFPKFSQLSLGASTSNGPPASPVRPRSPQKRAVIYTPSIREVQFRGTNGRPLKVLDGISVTGPPVMDGHHRPFARRIKEGQAFTVLTTFEWASHNWETFDIPCHRDTTETALFRCLCIHFSRFVKAMEKCRNPERCLCGGPNSSVTQEDVKILGYELFEVNDSLKIVVKAGTNA